MSGHRPEPSQSHATCIRPKTDSTGQPGFLLLRHCLDSQDRRHDVDTTRSTWQYGDNFGQACGRLNLPGTQEPHLGNGDTLVAFHDYYIIPSSQRFENVSPFLADGPVQPEDFLLRPLQEHIGTGLKESIAVLAGMINVKAMDVVLDDGDLQSHAAQVDHNCLEKGGFSGPAPTAYSEYQWSSRHQPVPFGTGRLACARSRTSP